MSDELVEMQRDAFARLLIATGIVGVAGTFLSLASSTISTPMLILWVGIILVNLAIYQLARTRLRQAIWIWICAMVGLLVVAIPWRSPSNLGPLPYGMVLLVAASGVFISRGGLMLVAALITVLFAATPAVVGQPFSESWVAILPPILITWGTALLSWNSSEQLLAALEWAQKSRQEANTQAEDLRQNRDALQKSLTIRDNLNAQLQEAHEQMTRRALQFETMAQVSRDITSLLDLDKVLAEVANLICRRFGYHCASVFMLTEGDADRLLSLQAAGGEQAPALLQRDLRLPPDDSNLNGLAVSTGQIQNITSVPVSRYPRRNDLLTDTLSELVIPLRLGQQTVGTLHVQSKSYAAFSKDDVAVLQGLADQVTVAIQNTRSFEQTQTALQEVEMTNRLLTQQGWQEYLRTVPGAVRQVEWRGSSAAVQPELITIPLTHRGTPMGELTLGRAGSLPWSEDEMQMIESIALQTVLAADNARLIEQTQRTLDETRSLYETSREITSAGEIRDVLAAVLDTLSVARTGLHAAAIALFDAASREQAAHIELVGAWDSQGTPRLAPGARFAIGDFPLFDHLSGNSTFVSADLLADPQVDDAARGVLGGLGFRAMAATPLVARNQWIGVMFAMVEQAHEFAPSELNFQRALADQAAVAIDNRRLLAETQRRAERERLIRQITTRIRAASNTRGVLETTAAELARSMGVPRAIVRLTMGEGTPSA